MENDSHDNAGGIERGVGLAERGDHAFAASFGGPQIDEEHLVFVMLDQLAEHMAAFGQIDGRELALEDGVLEVVAEIAHGLEDLAQSFIVANIVADEKRISHG